MELRKIDKNNVWKILKLKVRDDQDDFVASKKKKPLWMLLGTLECLSKNSTMS